MISGYVHPSFAPVAVKFERLFRKRRHGGGALAAYLDGELVLDVWMGYADPAARRPWERETACLSFSTTKGVLSTLLHRLADRGEVAYDEPVATYWPEFAQAGKEQVTVRHLLTHTAGLHNLRSAVRDPSELLDHRHMQQVLAARPSSPPAGKAPGYHGLTYGWLLSGLIEAVTQLEVRDALAKELAEPLGVDGLWFGAPDEERDRTARLFPGVSPGGLSVERLAVQALRFGRTRPLAEALLIDGFEELLFSGQMQDAPIPAVNGMFTARSLAKLYGALANRGRVEDVELLRPETVEEIGRVQRRERDYVLGLPMRWRLGYHQAFTLGRLPRKAFGHFGYGGSGAWADPQTGLSLAFVCNRLGTATTPIGDGRLVRLGAAALKVARQADGR